MDFNAYIKLTYCSVKVKQTMITPNIQVKRKNY